MIIGFKDTFKLFSILIVAACAVFVCALFFNYNLDIAAIENEISTEAGRVMYDAQVSTGKVTIAVTGGCLILTSVVMLIFYLKNYIDTHSKELGILKALGYSDFRIAKHFWIFGLSVFFGCTLGYMLAHLYMPTFYELQNAEGLLPAFSPKFHILPAILMIGVPTCFFMALSVFYSAFKLKYPLINLLKEKREYVPGHLSKDKSDSDFLKSVSKATIRSKKTLAFFVAFASFCFSAMVQMSISMKEIASEDFSLMILVIGLILAFMSLLMSLSSVIKGNAKTIAMMKVFGYEDKVCSRAILGVYRPASYVGFVIGTIYQYALLKIMVTVVFADMENMPEYNFSFKALLITIITYVIVYETIMYLYSLKVKKLSVKSVMIE